MNLISILFAVLLPVTLAQEVPSGCVTIENRFFFGYMVKGLEDDNHNVAFSATPEQWYIRKGLGVFKITHVATREELFESDEELSFSPGHPAYLRQRQLGVPDALWEIEPGSNADYFVCSGKEYEWQFNKVECEDKSFNEYEDTGYEIVNGD
ncbi:hypothetical protein pipiens_002465 [Culex pipiens pipiens]|uniref:Uncharacterized protein n=1 Tax=Culex pipiens pipiens TaxID=38569 RepID=A0ABD1DF03_CULPP